jgi:chemotaxis protein MotB
MGKHDLAEEPPQSAPEWIVTFTDMISLLVTFFIMLMSFSTMEPANKAVIQSAFGEMKGGVLRNEKGTTAVDEPPNDRQTAVSPLRGADRAHSRPPEELPENLEAMGQKLTEEHLQVDVEAAPDGLAIRFDESAGFAPGVAEVNDELRRSLVELARVLAHYSHLLVIEGHTDDAFSPTPDFPTQEALALARAANAARVMLEAADLGRDLIQVSGAGARSPLAPNDNAAGRSRNRRVEIKVIALTKARARALKAEFADRKAKENAR